MLKICTRFPVKYLAFVIVVATLSKAIAIDSENGELTESDNELQQNLYLPQRQSLCPEVRPMPEFNIFNMLGYWYVVQYYSSSEEALTYHCMRAEFQLSRGNMDMIMRLNYRYADDPNDETQAGNMTWQIPDPQKPEHWRHSEDHYKGVYNTDVVDTDYENWLLLLHCSDPEANKRFLSTFILSRTSKLDQLTTDYLREKVGHFQVDLDYLFPVNQTYCMENTEKPSPTPTIAATEHEIILPIKNNRKSRRLRG